MRNGRGIFTPPTTNSSEVCGTRSGLFMEGLYADRRIVRRPGTRFWVRNGLDRPREVAHALPTDRSLGGNGFTTKGGTMTPRRCFACAAAAFSLVALHARADSDADRERDRDKDR